MQTFNHFMLLLLLALSSVALAEELKFSYILPEGNTQCFMSNLIVGSKAIV